MYTQIHLSAYERSNRKFKNRLRVINASFDENNIEAVKSAGLLVNSREKVDYDTRTQETVAVMPFLGVHMGAGHSILTNRYEYLKVCFWSVHEVFPNVVVGVLSHEDVDWLRYFLYFCFISLFVLFF